MTSRLLVDKIEGKTTASTVQMPAGMVIQTETLARTRTARQTISSTSFVIINDGVGNFQLAITPKFASSKILGSVSLAGIATTTNATSIGIKIYRDSTEIALLDSHFGYNYDEVGDRHHFSSPFFDSPNSTSSVTYSIYAAVQGGSQTAFFFDTHISDNVTNTFILQEVAQ